MFHELEYQIVHHESSHLAPSRGESPDKIFGRIMTLSSDLEAFTREVNVACRDSFDIRYRDALGIKPILLDEPTE